ncbi:MAG TPA: M56 family metallopeptidase [Burkholderiaceae bacterium]|jgi:beta-lactamase regulating signal transducer with metallopeptidase domain
MFEALVNWLIAYSLHSTVVLGLAWLAERAGLLRRLSPAQAELGWRWALFGPVLSATWPLIAGLMPAHPAPGIEPAASVQTAPIEVAPAPITETTQTTAPAPQAEPQPDWLPTAAGAATSLWLVGALGALSLLGLGAMALAGSVRRLPANADAGLQAQLEDLCRRAQLRTPRLRVGSRWSSPLLTPGGTICLPRWVEALEPQQREAVLAHELGHLRRHDPAWRVAAQTLVGLAWLQPLNRIALRRLDLLAELACDAWAARLTGSPVPLAESLLHAAEQQRSSRRAPPRLATAMSSTPLVQRMHRLLQENPMNPDKPTARKTRWAIAAGVLLAVVAVPTVVVHNAGASAPIGALLDRLGGFSHAVFREGSITRIETGGPEGRIKIDIDGPVQFTDAEDDIVGVQGRLNVVDKRNGHTHHLLISAEDGKPMSRVYERDGQPIAQLNEQDHAWLADITSLIVQSTVSADDQVKRLLARGGVDAVLARIDKQTSDSSRSNLIQALLRTGAPSPATQDRLLAAVGGIRGDFDRRGALQALAENKLSEAQQITWLERDAEIGSDFESREALVSLAPQLLDSEPVLAAWSKGFKKIGSDFEKRNVIEALMASDKPTPARVSMALAASGDLGSDFEHRTALQTIGSHLDVSDTQQVRAYTLSAGRIGSDFERREALVSLVQTGKLKLESLDAVLDAATGMGSDFETRNVLQAVAEVMPNDAALISHYRKVARRLGDHERGQAEKALDHLDV